ncbi:MAG: ADP-ribosylation factor-like protein [Promethearchaeota archaeon]
MHKNLRPKISLVGFSGVGKTTITKLIRAEEIPVQHIPTITGDIATVKIGKLHFHLWDFAGQEQFSYLWNNFIKGSDAVILVTDSTLENVDKSKFFLELIKEQAPYAHTAIIGNKQDLKEALSPVQIENFLGLKAYSMIANDPNNRDKMIKIIADILEMSAEVSPLLKPLLERDKLIEEASTALKLADFDKAALLFDKISYLCIELGDDSLGKEFFEKSQKIIEMLEKTEPSQLSQQGLGISEEVEPIKKEQKVKPQISIKAVEVPQPSLSGRSQSEISQKKVVEKNLESQKKIEQVESKEWIRSSKKSYDQDKVFESKAEVKKSVLKLNPEDFMVKLKPKSIGIVPKDAKDKLKTTAYGHVKNINDVTEKITPNQVQTKEPRDFLAFEGSPSNKATLNQIKNVEVAERAIPMKQAHNFVNTHTPSISNNIEADRIKREADSIKRELIDLKSKKADLYKMSVDLERQELEKQITKEKLEEKMKEIDKYNERFDEKILELEQLLRDLQQ